MKLKKLSCGQVKPHIYFRDGRWHTVGLMRNPTKAPNYMLFKQAGKHSTKLNNYIDQK